MLAHRGIQVDSDEHRGLCGERASSAKSGIYRWMERRFQRLLARSTGLHVPVGFSDARLFSRRVVNYINQINDRHLLLKVLPFYAVHRFAVLEYAPDAPDFAFRDRSLAKSMMAGVAILLSNSIRPLRIVAVLALLASSLSLRFAGGDQQCSHFRLRVDVRRESPMTGAAKPQREHWAAGIELAAVLKKRTQHLHTAGRRYRPRRDGSLHPAKQQLQSQRLRIGLLPCEAGECAELVSLAPQIETHGAARDQIVFDLRDDCWSLHAAPPGQG
jgi:hypothetical protein